ncbi:1-acyl-sn-glycerol-3-phosphate acyltransferase [Natronosporangium hydrolyticum]|uniref:1-acyl-sn-glycerol-3-phosphate acyltransferase n=1 Tax=Natronosporangium hydrolyticum TaxID=2811111 RepID=A0A895YDS0_9ACTN|nr:1-acyl-sn-glycerol-3-phosphate acyltransferase [Natronosporangium hydrolyticum]QSB13593.1 1-acyl-sn-glycerol-3-phosphate acyltransferase [Natronosporangium hydrolyticum]
MGRRRLGFWRRLTVAIVKPSMLALTRSDWQGLDRVPADGGVILVGNHLSHADPLVMAHFVHDAGRWPQFLGKESLFAVPLMGRALRRLRQIPVKRGTVDAAKALDAAIAAVDAGDAVIIYPEGTTTREPELWPMRGRTGVARLWWETGAPVVPVAMWGPQRIFDPRTRKFRPRPRTPVSVIAGPPVDLSGYRDDGEPLSAAAMHEITDLVMTRVRDLLADLRGESPPPLWSPDGVSEAGKDEPR